MLRCAHYMRGDRLESGAIMDARFQHDEFLFRRLDAAMAEKSTGRKAHDGAR